MNLKELMDPANDERLHHELADVMRTAPRVGFDLAPLNAMRMVALLQLALRHPAMPTEQPETYAFGRGLVAKIAAALPKECLPVVAAGWDPRCDRKPTFAR
jgi:hypothetical protein